MWMELDLEGELLIRRAAAARKLLTVVKAATNSNYSWDGHPNNGRPKERKKSGQVGHNSLENT